MAKINDVFDTLKRGVNMPSGIGSVAKKVVKGAAMGAAVGGLAKAATLKGIAKGAAIGGAQKINGYNREDMKSSTLPPLTAAASFKRRDPSGYANFKKANPSLEYTQEDEDQFQKQLKGQK